MERVVPWSALCTLIEPFYPKSGNGRPPIGIERMLRIYFLQHWFNLSDPAVEEALYDSPAMRRFVGIDLGREPVPDETTVCRFRHLLEAHDLGLPRPAGGGRLKSFCREQGRSRLREMRSTSQSTPLRPREMR